jgi:hypothetical protein
LGFHFGLEGLRCCDFGGDILGWYGGEFDEEGELAGEIVDQDFLAIYEDVSPGFLLYIPG